MPIVIGLSILLQASNAAAQEAPTYGSVYQAIYDQEKFEYTNTATTDSISVFIPKIIPEKFLDIVPSDVDKAMSLGKESICIQEKNGDHPVSEGQCTETMITTQQLAKSNAWLQAAIEDLQVSATSYELGANPYGGNATSVLARIPSITAIWQSSTDTIVSPAVEQKVRAGVYPSNINDLVTDIENNLRALIVENEDTTKTNKEKFVAAVWRYRNGVISLGDDCDESNRGNGTELQFVEARFCEVENALRNLHGQLPTVFTPPLKKNELVVYPIKELTNLPVLVWARKDDVGLLWQTAVDPILPSLNCDEEFSYDQPNTICENGAILGGRYPEELTELGVNEGLCSHPGAKRGYLCRSIQNITCTDDDNTQNDILLTECNTPNFFAAPIDYTDSGPNICGVGGWQSESTPLPTDTPGIDANITPDECSNCAVDLECSRCEPGLTPKEEGGRIVACVDQDSEGLSSFEILAKLTLAQQRCNAPAGEESIWMQKFNTINGCCAAEYQAYTVACNAIAEIRSDVQAGSFDIANCALIFANQACGEKFGAPTSASSGIGVCGDTRLDKPADEVIDQLKEYLTDNADDFNIPTTCNEAVENLSQEAKNIKHSMPQVCTPECQTNYINTIGNNACYIGACVEQSLEENRLMPGRVTWKVQDPTFHLDPNREPAPAVNSNTIAPPIKPNIPAYKPLVYAEALDKAFCQAYGLPKLTPPILCSFDVRRRISLPGYTPGFYANEIDDQSAAIRNAQDTLHNVSAGIGARLGAALYAQYFENSMLSLLEIVTDVNTVLSDLEQTNLPQAMCPLNM